METFEENQENNPCNVSKQSEVHDFNLGKVEQPQVTESSAIDPVALESPSEVDIFSTEEVTKDKTEQFSSNIEDDVGDIAVLSDDIPSSRRKSSRRVSVGLSMRAMYDEEMHLPKYSQAEMDAVLEQHRLKLEEIEETDFNCKEKISTDHEAELASLKQNLGALNVKLAEKDSEIESLNGTFDSHKEDVSLSVIENKALTHRAQALEEELSNARSKIDTLTQELSSAQSREEETQAKEVELAKSEETSREANKQASEEITALKEEIKHVRDSSAAKEVELQNQMKEAVRVAKDRVYEKCKQQFDAGNKEFVKLKAELKEMSLKSVITFVFYFFNPLQRSSNSASIQYPSLLQLGKYAIGK
jgi:chromosome segregation ATPase